MWLERSALPKDTPVYCSGTATEARIKDLRIYSPVVVKKDQHHCILKWQSITFYKNATYWLLKMNCTLKDNLLGKFLNSEIKIWPSYLPLDLEYLTLFERNILENYNYVLKLHTLVQCVSMTLNNKLLKIILIKLSPIRRLKGDDKPTACTVYAVLLF